MTRCLAVWKSRLFAVCSAVFLTLLATRVCADEFSAVRALAERNGWDVSAEARLLDEPTPLAQLTPGAMMIPASVSKLYVATAMLDHYGPHYRFFTQLLGTGPVVNGTLQGDLILDGSGDPAFSTRDGWALVQSLRAAGIQRVTGQLQVSEWRFGPEPCLAMDRCRARDSSKNAYNARLSSAGLDYGTWCIQLTPGRAGDPAVASACEGMPQLPHKGQVITVPAGERSRFIVERVTHAGEDVLQFDGQLTEGSAPQRIYRASSSPASQSVITLQQLLEQAGILVMQGGKVTQSMPPLSARSLASIESVPLQMELMDMLAYSNNFMADAMTMALSPSVPSSLDKGCQAIRAMVATVPDHGPLELYSGSGLTPENRTSARGIVALLKAFYQQPALFPALLGSMNTPKDGTSRFIQQTSEPFASHAVIKTGTLDLPVPVRAIGGYFRTAQGRWGAFAVLLNGRTARTDLNWSIALPAISSDVGSMIQAH